MIVFIKQADNTGFHIRTYYCSIQYKVKNAFLLDELGGRWTGKVLDQWLNEL